MKSNIAFWDSSALLPLFCQQPATTISNRLVRQFRKLVVWQGTPIEIRSALARLHREGVLSDDQRDKEIKNLNSLRHFWSMMETTKRVCEIAEELPEKYGLRAMDAFQLAAALVWCKEKAHHRAFICFDIRLAQAAEKAGFKIYPKP